MVSLPGSQSILCRSPELIFGACNIWLAVRESDLSLCRCGGEGLIEEAAGRRGKPEVSVQPSDPQGPARSSRPGKVWWGGLWWSLQTQGSP